MQKRLGWLDNNGYIQNDVITYTKTTRFLMPLVGISEFNLEKVQYKLLINTYIKSLDEQLICVVLNKLDYPEESNNFINLQNLNEHFVDYIEEEEEYILIYQIPNHFKSDYDLILNGKYSKTSEPYKQILIRIYGYTKNEKCRLATVYDCLYPTIEKKKQIASDFEVDYKNIEEVSSKPDITYELFKPVNELL